MADTKISDLDAVTDVEATDEYVLARSGASKKITAADLGAGVSVMRGCRVILSTNISIVDGFSFNVVSFDAEEFDTDGFHSTSSDQSKLVVPTGLGGYYLCVAQYNVTTSNAGEYGIAIRKNGGGFDFVAEQQFGTVGQYHATPNASGLVHLNATDYVEMLVEQKTGGNLTIDESATFFSMVWLGT